ncbi:hypothetical protein LCGC14_0277750 [marine sediment metagenome]|uniref:Rad50/SbcC-type AAA domain-containing protein n=1 Tax=marine sediment metagenome TaxID=412755 RepID=A0A0F9WHP7_9ZZZZ
MKIIKIKNVVAEGFRSLAERTEVNLDRPGLNLVKGENGAGKTTLFEVVVWCIYGTNLKDTTNEKIPTWEDSRTDAFRGTYTETTIEVDGRDYWIVRTIGWSGGEGIGRDALVIRGQNQIGVHKKDVQAQIITLLGIDSQTFMASILFGQRMPKLVESDNKDKRDLFERLFETAFINDGKAKAGAKLLELSVDCLKAEGEQNSLTLQMEALTTETNEQTRLLEEFEDKKVENCNKISEDIANTRDDLTACKFESEELTVEIDKWDAEAFDKFKTEMDELERQYNALEKTLEVPYNAHVEAGNRLGIASRADVVAETNVNIEKKRCDKWVIDKAGAVSGLKDELQELTNKKAEEIKAVKDICYACEQKLPLANVTAVKNSIVDTYIPQLEAADAKLEAKKAEKPPISNLPELKDIRKGAIKELGDAGNAAIKAKDAHNKAEEDGQDVKRMFTEGTKKEMALQIEAGEITKKTEKVTSNENEIKVYTGQIEVMISSLETAQKEEPPKFSHTIDQLIDKYDKFDKGLDEMNITLEDIAYEMNLHQWWTKKGFVAAGLPSFVFKAMLNDLNEYVKPYSDRLGVSIEFSIDLTKASKPFTTVCSVGKKFNKEYKEFSGGQKQRLDIVLIFAMYTLVSADSNIDILIMDEIFEGLDEAGEAAVFDLIRAKAEEGKSIYVITHSPHIDSLYSSTLTAVADELGATKIIG